MQLPVVHTCQILKTKLIWVLILHVTKQLLRQKVIGQIIESMAVIIVAMHAIQVN